MFSMITTRGARVRTHASVAGNPLRGSSAPLPRPVAENGWSGGDDHRTSTTAGTATHARSAAVSDHWSATAASVAGSGNPPRRVSRSASTAVRPFASQVSRAGFQLSSPTTL